MKIACEKCGTSFEVNAGQIPPDGLPMKCTSCFHTFTVQPATLELPTAKQADFILSNNPDDFAAPVGYVDPTTKNITAYNEDIGGAEVSDLPGLPSRKPAEVSDLPGLPSRKQSEGLTDLPGLPQRRAAPADLPGNASKPPKPEITDLPGLPSKRGGAEVTDLPGLPKRAPAAGLADLPGLPQSGGGGALDDLPGLPKRGGDLPPGLPQRPASSSPAGLDDLPGLPQRPASSAPAGLDDLPGLPQRPASSAPAGLDDLPGLPSHGGITDLPGTPGQASPGGSSGMDYGELELDNSEDVSFELDDIPITTNEKPPAQNLPPPATTTADDFELPAPVRPAESPTPVADVAPVKKSALDSDIISFEAPPEDEGAGPMTFSSEAVEGDEATETTTQNKKGKGLPSKRVMILVVAIVVILAGGGYAATVLLGSSGGKASSTQMLSDAQRKLRLDTLAGYGQAAQDFAEAAKKLEGDARDDALTLQAHALAARAYRFGSQPSLRDAQVLLDKLGGGNEDPPHPLKVALALLELAHAKTPTAQTQLRALSQAKPKDVHAALYLGWAELEAGDLGEAKKAFARAQSADSSYSGALYGSAQVAFATKKKKEALSYCDRVLSANQGHADAALLKASLLLDAKKSAEAQILTKRVLSLAWRGGAARSQTSLAHALNAEAALAKGDTNAARDAYAKAIKFDPRNHRALMGSARLALRAKRFAEASDYLSHAKAIKPSDVETTLLLAETKLALGKPIDARDALKATLAAHPKNPQVHFVRALIEDKLGAYDNAIKAYKHAIKLAPKYFAPYLHLSRLHLRRKERSLAFGVLMQANTTLKNAEVRNAIGEAHFAGKELKKAQVKFEEALAMNPKLDIALFNLANTLRDQGQNKEALAKYQELEKRDRSYPGLAAATAQLHMLAGDPVKAADAFTLALEADQAPIELRLKAARAFIDAGRYDDCYTQVRAVMRDKPMSIEARALRAEASLGKGKLQEALAEIRSAIERNEQAPYLVVKARVYERMGKMGDAVLAYDRAIKLAPKVIDYQLQRARLKVRAGAVKDGLATLKKIIAKQPKLAPAHLYRGIALIELGQEAQGLSALRKSIALDPELAEAHQRLALAAIDARQAAKAYHHLELAAKHGKPGEAWLPDTLFRFGELAAKKGAKKKAIAALRRFLKLAPPRNANIPTAKGLLEKLGAAPKAPKK